MREVEPEVATRASRCSGPLVADLEADPYQSGHQHLSSRPTPFWADNSRRGQVIAGTSEMSEVQLP